MRRYPLWQLISGKQFNELSRGQKFYKLTFPIELHRGFWYRDGLNVDVNPLVPRPYRPGLHFTEERLMTTWMEIFSFMGTPVRYRREVQVPDHAQVYCLSDQFKADQLILGPREEL